MKSLKFTPVIGKGLCGLLLGAALAAPLAAQEHKAALHTRHYEHRVAVTATVQSVDLAKRELTLRGPLGNVETVKVSDKVKRLDELKGGDEVNAEYYIGIATELRPPTAEEKKEPLVILGGEGRAPKGEAPAGGYARAVRVVATVEGLDRPTQTVTLKGPMGRYLTVRVSDPSVLEKPRLGDTVVVTCAEALAVSVEKVEKPKSKE